MLARLKRGEAHSAQMRMKMQTPLACRARLTVAQARELFGVAAQQFDLETRFVIAVERLG